MYTQHVTKHYTYIDPFSILSFDISPSSILIVPVTEIASKDVSAATDKLKYMAVLAV